ncbi:MAG: sigma-54-dependent transcriptional regulator [Legionella sp.]
MNIAKVLIIDDEPDMCELLSITLRRMGLIGDIASDVKQSLALLTRENYVLVLSDMCLPDGDGYEIIRFLQKNKPHIPIAVITAYGNIEGAVSALKAGAFDYLSKPIDLPMLESIIQKAILPPKKQEISHEILLGNSPAMQQLKKNIEKLSRSQAPVFIYGESGAGKELVARSIHAAGPRAEQPFIAVNCAAIPSELMESEFFGHKKGSFTGAFVDKQGLFCAAQGGTLFLDEIAELPLAMQVKLLRVIQEKAVKPIGDNSESPVDVRILSASNKNLQTEIDAGRFRQELYYRINVIELKVPSLVERLSDIPILVDNILTKLAKEKNCQVPLLSTDCLHFLQSYSYPGNVRELENIIERAMTLCSDNLITSTDLQLQHSDALSKKSNSKLDLGESLELHEKELILDALEQTKWNRTAAARLLGISFRTLRYRIKKLGLDAFFFRQQ